MTSKAYGLEPSPLRIADHSTVGTPDELRRARERQLAGREEFKRYEQSLRANKSKGCGARLCQRRHPFIYDCPATLKPMSHDALLDDYGHDQETVSTSFPDFVPQEVVTDPSLSTEYIPTLSPTSRRPRLPQQGSTSSIQRAGSGGQRLNHSPTSRVNLSPRSWQPSSIDRPTIAPFTEINTQTLMTRYPTMGSYSGSEEQDRSMRMWERQARSADQARDREWLKLARKARVLRLSNANFLLPSQGLSAFEQNTSPVLSRVWLDQAGEINLTSPHGPLLLEEPLQSVFEELIFQVENSLLREGALKEELNRLKGRVANLNRQLMNFRRQSDSYDEEEEERYYPQRTRMPPHHYDLGYVD